MKKNLKSSLFLSSALRESLVNYNLTKLRSDFVAALVVSLVSLPLAMALAIAVGLPPQHGIYTSIIAGIITPLFGGSIWQVSGPTAAFVVILNPIVLNYGLHGIIWAGIFAGFILIVLGFTKLGKLINYVPYPVTTGFTSGIAVVLATISLNDFFGLGIKVMDGNFINKLILIYKNFPSINLATTFIGIVTLIILFSANRFIRFIPSTMLAIIVAIFLSILFSYGGYDISTIGSNFTFTDSSGAIYNGIPSHPPILHLPTFIKDTLYSIPSLNEIKILMQPALAIAILIALESLLSATIADSLANTKHNPNAELTSIGIANIFSALASGIPATGAIARTTTNINSGAKSPIASSLHAIFILLYVLFFAKYLNYIPMVALAALLLYTAFKMSHYKQFIHILEIASINDIIVLLTCFTLTVFVDMVIGVTFGMLCAAFLLINRIIKLTHVEIEGNSSETEDGILSLNLPKGIMVYTIRGFLFFGTIEKAFDRSNFSPIDTKQLIINISDVPFIDMTALVAMQSFLLSVASDKCNIHIVCKTTNIVGKIRKKIKTLDINKYIFFYIDLQEAINKAKIL